MKIVARLLEPLIDQDMDRVHRDLAKLRSGSSMQWAIGEVLERLLATTELIVAVDAMSGGKDGRQGVQQVPERPAPSRDDSGNGRR